MQGCQRACIKASDKFEEGTSTNDDRGGETRGGEWKQDMTLSIRWKDIDTSLNTNGKILGWEKKTISQKGKVTRGEKFVGEKN